MSEMHLRETGLTYSAYGPFTKKKKSRIKKFKETSDSRYILKNLINLAFSTIWFMEILKICLEEQPPIKYCVMKHLMLIKSLNLMDIKEVLLQWFINLSIKRLQVVMLKVKLCRTNN